MSPLAAIARQRIRILRNRLLDLHRDAVAKALVIVLGLSLVTGVSYQVAYWSFSFIEGFPAIGTALNERLLSLLFLILLVMVALSTAVIVYVTLFLAAETEFLFQHPAPPRLIFFVKLIESVAFSSWATLVLGVPVLAAFGRARRAAPIYYLESTAALVLFLVFCGLAGAAFIFLLQEIVRRWTWRRLAVAVILLVGIPAWFFIRSFDFGGLTGEENLMVLDRFTAGIAAIRSPFFPGHWAAAAVVSSSSGNHGETLFQGGLLLANTLIFLPILAAYGRRRYGGRWLLARDPAPVRPRSPRAAAEEAAAVRARRKVPIPRTPSSALNWKDALTFSRDPAQLSQFFLFLLLLAVYVASLLRVPGDLFGRPWRLMIYFGNLGAISLVLSSFTSRFIFPLLSLEGRSIWIVGLAPVRREYLVTQKTLAGGAVILILGLAAALASNLFLGFGGWDLAAALYFIALIGICLTALATGLGAAYPSLGEDNPARIAVGLGGTLNFFSSAAAILVLLCVEGAPYVLYKTYPPPWALALAHGLTLVLAAAVSAFVLRLGRRALRSMEF